MLHVGVETLCGRRFMVNVLALTYLVGTVT